MAVYEVQHAYRSTRDGVQYGPWQPGETVELADADAEWVCRDSPGCLLAAGGIIEAEPDVEPKPVREKPPAANRQARQGRNR